MKKRPFCLTFILFITIVLSPSISFAADALNIDRWIVDAYLLKNGDLQISEDITFNFNSSFDDIGRNINLEKIDSIEGLSVYELVDGQEIPYKEADKPKKGDKHKFIQSKEKNDLQVIIFAPSKDERKTFRLKYLLKSIAIKHSDTAEVYYKFLGNQNETSIDYFSINLHLPIFERDKINIFAHGPIQAKIYFSDEKVKSEINDVSSGQFIKNRILFPNEYIPLSKNTGSQDFTSIMKEERLLAEKLEVERKEKVRRKKLLYKGSIYTSFLIALIVFGSFLIKRLKETKMDS